MELCSSVRIWRYSCMAFVCLLNQESSAIWHSIKDVLLLVEILKFCAARELAFHLNIWQHNKYLFSTLQFVPTEGQTWNSDFHWFDIQLIWKLNIKWSVSVLSGDSFHLGRLYLELFFISLLPFSPDCLVTSLWFFWNKKTRADKTFYKDFLWCVDM